MTYLNINTPTITMGVTTSSDNTALPGLDKSGNVVNVYNAGLNDAFLVAGGSSVAAVFPNSSNEQNGTVIPAGKTRILSLPPDATHLAAICAPDKTSTTLHIQRGYGKKPT